MPGESYRRRLGSLLLCLSDRLSSANYLPGVDSERLLFLPLPLQRDFPVLQLQLKVQCTDLRGKQQTQTCRSCKITRTCEAADKIFAAATFDSVVSAAGLPVPDGGAQAVAGGQRWTDHNACRQSASKKPLKISHLCHRSVHSCHR